MALTNKQKKFIKHNIRQLGLEKTAETASISSEAILKYLTDIWGRKKVNSVLFNIQKNQDNEILKQISFKKWLSDNWKILIFIIVLVVLSYGSSFANEFVSDDITAIAKNDQIGKLSYLSSSGISVVRTVQLFVLHGVFGANPLFYRLINVLLHAGSVILLFAFLSKTTSKSAAIITSLIASVHPIFTETVTWISGGGYVLYTFFFLISLNLYLLPGKKYMFASVCFFALCLFSSDKAFPMSMAFVLYEISRKSFAKNWKRTLPYVILSVIWIFLLIFVFRFAQTRLEIYETEQNANTYLNPLVLIPAAIGKYIQLIFFPLKLSFFYPDLQFTVPDFLFRTLIFIVFLCFIIISFRKNRMIFFLLSLVPLSLVPVLTPFRFAWVVAERYIYFGALFVIASISSLLPDKIINNQKRMILVPILTILVSVLMVRTVIRNLDWKNQNALYTATAKTAPNDARVHNNIGNIYYDEGKLDKALSEYEIALKIRPEYPGAYHNIGLVKLKEGKTEEAILSFQKALSINPKFTESLKTLSEYYFNNGKYQEALYILENSEKADPKNIFIQLNLGIINEKINNIEKARLYYSKALEIDPNSEAAKWYLSRLK